jgi:hypothetical protein
MMAALRNEEQGIMNIAVVIAIMGRATVHKRTAFSATIR